jgi:hypothetical protein
MEPEPLVGRVCTSSEQPRRKLAERRHALPESEFMDAEHTLLEATVEACRKAEFKRLWQEHLDEIRGYIRLDLDVEEEDMKEFLRPAFKKIKNEWVRNYDPAQKTFMEIVCPELKRQSGNYERNREKLDLAFHLEQIFSMKSPPHQLILFGFVHSLGWPPAKVAAKTGKWQLKAMLSVLSVPLYERSGRTVRMKKLICRLERKMTQPLGTVITHWRSRQTYGNILSQPTGDLRLYQYGKQSRYKTLEELPEYITACVNNILRQILGERKRDRDRRMNKIGDASNLRRERR